MLPKAYILLPGSGRICLPFHLQTIGASMPSSNFKAPSGTRVYVKTLLKDDYCQRYLLYGSGVSLLKLPPSHFGIGELLRHKSYQELNAEGQRTLNTVHP